VVTLGFSATSPLSTKVAARQIQLPMADNYLQAVSELVGHQTIVLDQQDGLKKPLLMLAWDG
jgi:hypothetical protein